MARDSFQLQGDAAEIYEAQKVKSIFGPLARATVEAVTIDETSRVLDLACGTGIMARTLRDVVGPSIQIVGADLNEGMIATARRLTADDPGPTQWFIADAGDLPFEVARFTDIFCQQGFQYFPDELAALAEMRRVLNDGGRLFLTIWAGPNDFFKAMARAISHHVDPALGERSLAPFSYAGLAVLPKLLEGAGFSDVLTQDLTIERVISEPEVSIEKEILGNPVGQTVKAAGADTMRTIVSEIIRDCAANWQNDTLVFPQRTHLISARVPV